MMPKIVVWCKDNKIIYIWNLNITGTTLFPHRTCQFWED